MWWLIFISILVYVSHLNPTPQHKTPQPTKTICVIFHCVREKNKTKHVNSSRLANTLTSFIISTSICLWLPGYGHYPQCCLKRPWRWPQTDFMNLSNVFPSVYTPRPDWPKGYCYHLCWRSICLSVCPWICPGRISVTTNVGQTNCTYTCTKQWTLFCLGDLWPLTSNLVPEIFVRANTWFI